MGIVEVGIVFIALVVLVGVVAALTKLRTIFGSKPVQAMVKRHFRPLPLEKVNCAHRVFPMRVKADLQRILEEEVLSGFTVLGFTGIRQEYETVGLEFSALTSQGFQQVNMSPPQFEEVDIGEDRIVRCLTNGLWLLEKGDSRLALLVSPAHRYNEIMGIRVEVAFAPDERSKQWAPDIFKQIQDGIANSRTYRGKVLSLEPLDRYSGLSAGITVHRLRKVKREELVLPMETLGLLERNLLEFAKLRDDLAASGMSCKKGLLFYGPPGTGKTHTIHYLADAMKEHTFLLVTAEQQGLIEEYITLARLLQPSVIVVEDADLIARARSDMPSPCAQSILNRLLNEMDGLRVDSKVFFVLTTNRPESLEPALRDRPGRIDQAIEFPLPDEAGRASLLRLYRGRFQVADDVEGHVVRKTDGVSASFMKELARRAAQFALAEGRKESLTTDDFEKALQELLRAGGAFQSRLMGSDQN